MVRELRVEIDVQDPDPPVRVRTLGPGTCALVCIRNLVDGVEPTGHRRGTGSVSFVVPQTRRTNGTGPHGPGGRLKSMSWTPSNWETSRLPVQTGTGGRSRIFVYQVLRRPRPGPASDGPGPVPRIVSFVPSTGRPTEGRRSLPLPAEGSFRVSCRLDRRRQDEPGCQDCPWKVS